MAAIAVNGSVPGGAELRGRQTEPGQPGNTRCGQAGPHRRNRVGGLYLRGTPRTAKDAQKGQRMRIERRFTKDGQSPYAEIEFRSTTSEIRNPDGSTVFKADGVEVPEFWSQVASDVLAQKYFRKAGVPARLKKVEEETVPSFLWRSVADEEALASLPEKERIVGETSAKQVFDRLAGTWTYWGWKGGYFDSDNDAQAFFDELRYMLATQRVAPNSPQWFNTGLHWAYGIDGPSQGHYYVDFQTGKLTKSKSSYEHPQPPATRDVGTPVETTFETGTPEKFVGYPDMVREFLDTLVTNAIKYGLPLEP